MSNKIIITNSDLEVTNLAESVSNTKKSPSLGIKIILFPLVFLFPILCFVAIIIRLAANQKNYKEALGWIKYSNTLLIFGGLINIIAAIFCFQLKYDLPSINIKNRVNSNFVLNSNNDFPQTYSKEELKTKDLAKKVENNIFIISKASKWTKPSKKQLLENGFGTSFLVFVTKDDCLLVTCKHVLDGEDWETEKPFKGDVVLWDRRDGFGTAKIVGRHKSKDLLLLGFKRPPNLNNVNFSQPILDFNKVELGEHVFIYGHPEGLFFSIADGLISRKEEKGILQISAPVSPGDSGGPVYDFHGQLLGIISSMLDKSINKNSENLNFAISSESLLNSEDWILSDYGKSLLSSYIEGQKKEQNNRQQTIQNAKH